jgi:hypothetical protein
VVRDRRRGDERGDGDEGEQGAAHGGVSCSP